MSLQECFTWFYQQQPRRLYQCRRSFAVAMWNEFLNSIADEDVHSGPLCCFPRLASASLHHNPHLAAILFLTSSPPHLWPTPLSPPHRDSPRPRLLTATATALLLAAPMVLRRRHAAPPSTNSNSLARLSTVLHDGCLLCLLLLRCRRRRSPVAQVLISSGLATHTPLPPPPRCR